MSITAFYIMYVCLNYACVYVCAYFNLSEPKFNLRFFKGLALKRLFGKEN